MPESSVAMFVAIHVLGLQVARGQVRMGEDEESVLSLR